MVHEVKDLKDAILEYFKTTQGYTPDKIAILIESNTGLAQALVQHERKKGGEEQGSPVEFLFPLQVSEVRKAYEKAGLLRGGKADDPAAPERLRIPPDEGGTPRDLPRSYTPATSAALDELALTQVLTTIARRPYQAVGIVATDPHDVVFLAREGAPVLPERAALHALFGPASRPAGGGHRSARDARRIDLSPISLKPMAYHAI